MHKSNTKAVKKSVSGTELKERHKRHIRRRNIAIICTRVFTVAFIVFVTLTVVLYLNPLFNIDKVNIAGNNRVDIEYLQGGIDNISGVNIFRVSKKSILKEFSGINYIQDIDVKKSYFPPIVDITISEAQPYGCAKIGEKYIMFDKNCKTLEDSTAFIDGAPRVYGTDDIPIEEFKTDGKNNKVNALIECLDKMNETGVLEKVSQISVESISNITFDYDNRFHVILGSAYDVDSKLMLFMTALNNASISDNAQGTMDLSTGGTALYTP